MALFSNHWVKRFERQYRELPLEEEAESEEIKADVFASEDKTGRIGIILSDEAESEGEAEAESEAAGVCADVADRSAQLLYQEGIRVYLTDTSPESETAVTPAQLMEETGADIYIGLDVAHDGPAYHGIRTYYDPLYYIPGFGSIELSESCLKNTAISVSNRALGISEAPQGNVLYEINAPATLLIIGNADNQDEYALLTEDSYRERLANGIYETVKESAGMMGDV